MVRLLILLLTLPMALVAFAPSARSADETAVKPEQIEAYVHEFNPDIFKLNADGTPVVPMRNAFSTPASDIAQDVASNNTFNLLVYLPFLILPQVLLVIVIFKFRDRGDGRKPATFMTNHKLEVLWTVIPCLALVIVSVPVWKLLYKMELPPTHVDTNNPDQATIIKVTGMRGPYSWEYEYKAEGMTVHLDAAGGQEPMVIVKDRVVSLNITSNDVNHAWWVPAFGVKKSAIKGRFTNTWFTPTMLGIFKGQCAELCGDGHGIMFISSVVVDAEDFRVYRLLQRHRADTDRIWNILRPGPGVEIDQPKLQEAVAKYFEKDTSEGRKFALRYWVAANFDALHRRPQDKATLDDLKLRESQQRARIETLVSSVAAPAAPLAVEAAPAADSAR